MSIDTSFDPRSGNPGRSVPHSTEQQLDEAVARAVKAASTVADVAPGARRDWLYSVADALEARSDELVLIADRETALGDERLTAEVTRAAGQLRFYGDVAAEGFWLDVILESATATSPQMGRMNIPLGPVAVFGASNFPFGFGALGNDTAAAIAAGCPVVVKAHPAHPLLSQTLAEIATAALRHAGAPDGIFELVTGFESGMSLVKHRDICAVAFTGSQAGGMALWKLANQRETVIPVFSEMGTVNPVVVTDAAKGDMATIAGGFVASYTSGSGQYCTKPGLLFAPRGASAPGLIAQALRGAQPRPVMLTESIAKSVTSGIAQLENAGATVIEQIASDDAGWSAPAAVLAADIDLFRADSRVLEECFGPVAIVVEYDSVSEVVQALHSMQGALAASLFAGDDSDNDAAVILAALTQRVGRVVLNGWPTGVSFNWAQQHGGPWPATTVPGATSVGAAALNRFVRPIAYQDLPDQLLPTPLTELNPWGVPRRVDGRFEVTER